MASTKDLKAKFEKEATKAGAEPAPDTTAGKKATFEKAIKDAAPKDPKPKKSWAAGSGKSDPLAQSHTKYKATTKFDQPPPEKKSISDLP